MCRTSPHGPHVLNKTMVTSRRSERCEVLLYVWFNMCSLTCLVVLVFPWFSWPNHPHQIMNSPLHHPPRCSHLPWPLAARRMPSHGRGPPSSCSLHDDRRSETPVVRRVDPRKTHQPHCGLGRPMCNKRNKWSIVSKSMQHVDSKS